MKSVKITVLKKIFNEELAEEYLTDGIDSECDEFEVGDEFIYNGGAIMPEGFCPWAWVDVYHYVRSTSMGASCKPWINRDGLTVVCCSDGVRPVIFKVEAIDDK